MDGATNDRTALVNADAVGSVRISKPVYVATSMTFTNPVEFVGNGKIVGPSSTVITIPGGVNAQKRLIFDGVQVSGLFEAWLEWFAADVKTFGSTMPSTVATSRIQRAVDAVGGGVLWAGRGNWLHDGSVINANAGASFQGAGEGATGTRFYWNGLNRSFLQRQDTGAGIRGGFWSRFSLQPLDESTVPNDTVALDVNQSNVTVDNIIISFPGRG
ncbi:hypothetical protein LTR94_030694, partial [Friedmanniomyces endolithicus]